MNYLDQYDALRKIAVEMDLSDVEQRICAGYGMNSRSMRELGKAATFSMLYGVARGGRVHDSIIVDDLTETEQHSTTPRGSRLVRALIRKIA